MVLDDSVVGSSHMEDDPVLETPPLEATAECGRKVARRDELVTGRLVATQILALRPLPKRSTREQSRLEGQTPDRA